MKVLIFEESLSGHRGYYVSVLLRELLRKGAFVKLALPKGEFQSVQFRSHLADISGHFESVPFDGPWNGASLNTKCVQLKQLASLIERIRPGHTYVPCADIIAKQWGLPWNAKVNLRRFGPIEGLIMRCSGAYPADSISNSVRTRITDHLIQCRPWDRLHTLDPLSFLHLNQRGFGAISLLPEAVEPFIGIDKNEARRKLHLSQERFIITCPGGVQHRKGSHLLVAAMRNSLLQGAQVVLIGPHTPEMSEVIRQNAVLVDSGLVVARNKYATPLEFEMLFHASDLVAVPYLKHQGSASILIRAAKAQKKIVASNWGWVGWATRRFELGVAVDVENESSLHAALLNSRQRDESSEGTSMRAAFMSYHTLQNHLSHWMRLYCTNAGLRSEPCVAFPGVEGVAGANRAA